MHLDCIEGMPEERRGTTRSCGAGNLREKIHGGLRFRTLALSSRTSEQTFAAALHRSGRLWTTVPVWSSVERRASSVEGSNGFLGFIRDGFFRSNPEFDPVKKNQHFLMTHSNNGRRPRSRSSLLTTNSIHRNKSTQKLWNGCMYEPIRNSKEKEDVSGTRQ
jgi:hypothetical protein